MKEKRKKANKQTKNDRKEQAGDGSYSERVRAKWFCCAFKLGFLHLICKASVVFRSSLEFVLSITSVVN